MAEIARRLDRLERLIEAEDCRCDAAENEFRCVEVDPEWSAEQIRLADDATQFNCPIHGLRRPTIVHLGPVDALL